MEDSIFKLGEERRREVAALAERRLCFPISVPGPYSDSWSCHRSINNGLNSEAERERERERDDDDVGSDKLFLRERLEDTRQHDVNGVPIEESMQAQSLDVHIFVIKIPADQSDGENAYFPDLVSTREIESWPKAFFIASSEPACLQERQSTDAS